MSESRNPRPSLAPRRPAFTRRGFIKLAALAAVPVPRFLVDAAEAAERLAASGSGPEDRILVMVQLSGGNDGLNTVIPVEDPRYHNARPTLAVPPDQALRLEKGGPLGFHPSLEKLHGLFGEGRAAVIQGVGYPNPNRSHFRSMEIWHSARPESEESREGWLGRAIARGRFEAIDIGDREAPLALAAEGVQVPVLQNLDWLEALFTSRGSELRRMLAELTERRRGGDLEFLRGAVRSTFTQLGRLEEIRGRRAPVEYPDTRFGKSLEWIGQLIAGGFPSRIYYLSLDGFDTHAQQKDAHALLLRMFSDGVAAFFQHLDKVGLAQRVALATFSEFGRRVRENGSLGTDHGCAGPMFLVSGACRGGVLGEAPDLERLEDGDVRFRIDFRRVYATLLKEVLGLEPAPILGGAFAPLPLLERFS